MTTSTRPFKKLFCDRDELLLLPPVALKIWLYHYMREGTKRESWPAVETVMTACGITRSQTFYKWRAYLRDNGWLEKIGEKPSKNEGGKPVPIFKVTRGTIPAKVRKAHQTKGAKSALNPVRKAHLTSAKSAPNLSAESALNPGTQNALRSRAIEVEPNEVNPTEVDGVEKRSVGSFSGETQSSGLVRRDGKLVWVGGAR
jgi:hypothetical protein